MFNMREYVVADNWKGRPHLLMSYYRSITTN